MTFRVLIRPGTAAVVLLASLPSCRVQAQDGPGTPAPASVQQETADPPQAPLVLTLPASVRAMGLGNAYMMNSGHADGVFYHPALVAGAGGWGIQVQSFGGQATSMSASAAGEWLGGSAAIGLQVLQHGADGGETLALSAGAPGLFGSGVEPLSEAIASMAYAREIFGVRVGVTGKLLDERVGIARDRSALLDVGIAADAGPLVVGLSALNLGKDLSLGGETAAVPTRIALGVGAYGQPVGPLDVGISLTTSYEDGWLGAGGGLEVGYWPVLGRTFVGRVGLRRVRDDGGSPLTVGGAYWRDDLVLEWAMWPRGGRIGSAAHRFAIRWTG
ncbi:MAG: hypothetical protein ACE5GJ_07065 [Gemmatimonadota bacterium]